LVSAETKKDRKVYSLTKAGQTKLGEETKKMAGEPAGNAATSGMSSSWLSFDPSFLSTASKLGPVLLDLAQTGTKAQQEKATKVLEETRHQLHKILADN
jgi:DNA-binding PadR family transcriptional regulator